MDRDFDSSLDFAMNSLNLPFKLKAKQVDTLRALYSGQDVIAVLPTGYGKSIIFQLLPWLMQAKHGRPRPMIVLVICPLSSIMQDQVESLRERGIKACFLNIEGSGGRTYQVIQGKCRAKTAEDEDRASPDLGPGLTLDLVDDVNQETMGDEEYLRYLDATAGDVDSEDSDEEGELSTVCVHTSQYVTLDDIQVSNLYYNSYRFNTE